MRNIFRLLEMPGVLAFLILAVPLGNPILEQPPENFLSSVFFDCPQDSAEKDGSSSCARIFPDGTQLVLSTRQERFGNDVKLQTQSVELDPQGKTLKQETLRRKIVYTPDESQKIRKEFFDVVQTRKNGATRDIIFYEFYPRTHQPKNVFWSRYEQPAPGKLAKITRYLSLSYNSEGHLMKSQSHSWTYTPRPVKIFPARQISKLQNYNPWK